MWITVVVIGLIVIAILLAMLHQQKQNSPESQASSYSSSAKKSSVVESNQDDADSKAYAKKAIHMKGHVVATSKGYMYTSWSKQNFEDWVNKYSHTSKDDNKKMAITMSDKEEQDARSESFGTSYTAKGKAELDNMYSSLSENLGSVYWSTVTDFNHSYPNYNPKYIQR